MSIQYWIATPADADFESFYSTEVKPMRCQLTDDARVCWRCTETEAQFWSVYVQNEDRTMDCVADLPSREAALSVAHAIEVSIVAARDAQKEAA